MAAGLPSKHVRQHVSGKEGQINEPTLVLVATQRKPLTSLYAKFLGELGKAPAAHVVIRLHLEWDHLSSTLVDEVHLGLVRPSVSRPVIRNARVARHKLLAHVLLDIGTLALGEEGVPSHNNVLVKAIGGTQKTNVKKEQLKGAIIDVCQERNARPRNPWHPGYHASIDKPGDRILVLSSSASCLDLGIRELIDAGLA